MHILQSPTPLRFSPKPEKPTTTTTTTTTATFFIYLPHQYHPRYLQSTKAVAATPLTHNHSHHHQHQLFDEIPLWDTFAWNTLIQTHLENNDFTLVLFTYIQMLQRGVPLDRRTLPRVVDASRLMGDFLIGKQLHAHALKLGFSSDQFAVTALIEMYGHLGSVDMAQSVFDNSPHRNSVCWTLLARLYIAGRKPGFALALFHQMVELGILVDRVALATACGACGLMKSLSRGRDVHDIARKCGLDSDVLVCNSLLKMYIDCDSVRDARLVFKQMPSKDVISWTSMIHAYVKRGGFNEAFKLFRRMVLDGLKPDPLSIASFLPACGRIASHKHGREIHAYLLRNGIHTNLKVKNALMDMYVKSGDITSASNVFAGMKEEKDTISWTMMILGYSLHGQGKLGVGLFKQMEKNSKVQLDDTAYAAALHACCTARMVEEGKIYFNCIKVPTAAHCALKVALLARCGRFDEARNFIKEQELEKHPEVLRKLLEGCRIHSQYTLGKHVIEQLCDLEPLNAENYVLLLNWYAGSAKFDMVEKLRETIRDMGLKPKKTYTWTLFRNKVHVFGTGDVSHPRSGRLYSELQSLIEDMRAKGLEPNWDFRLHDVDEERECIQIGHSELLATAFGLISSQAGPIRLAKNSRVCHGCHGFVKFASKMMGREIILKDPNFFHHFKDGLCSCEDFW